MRRRLLVLGLLAWALTGLPASVTAQRGPAMPPPRTQAPDPSGFYLAGGVALGATRAFIPGRDTWTAGPVVSARVTKLWRRTGASLVVDHQLYGADQPTGADPFRTTFILPSLVTGTENSQLRLSAGAIIYDFEEADTRTKFAFGLSFTHGLPGPFLVEGAWRREASNAPDVRAELYSLGVLAVVRF